ncbi:DM13 domain-containing protein [Paenibacillus sp. YYML68]|uniref:DM13 domain-containing protein n=1 Tax=Paenibacillus sp. YYML68 TaxID=2909250 RepID=UPI0024908DE4|nr:DM13 domain-containing protein [Paenibacillus sp. YYML68]
MVKKTIGIISLIVVIGIGWWLGSPLLISKHVEEALPASSSTRVSSNASEQPGQQPPSATKEEAAAVVPKPDATPAAASEDVPTRYEGSFVDGDPGHYAQGKVYTVVADGKSYLRLESLDATNGPDLFVYVKKGDQKTSEGISLGQLKGNTGSHNYELPDGLDLTQNDTVVIYCRAFHVDFGYAALKPAAKGEAA